jgi:formate-dependent nitrite reductase membrane component NrfD
MSDGRNIDRAIGTLAGEAAEIEVERPDVAWPLEGVPHATAERESTTYYGLPVVKAPPWRPFVPAYFYVGGTAGASLVIAAAASLGDPDLRPLVVRGRAVGVAGIALGSLLLVADLGQPSRFLNMLRVFRPTSPLNVGTWLLSSAGTTAGLALLSCFGGRRAQRIGDAVGILAGLLGAGVSTYTAVVVANTAIPVWAKGARALPILFAGSALSSAGALLSLTVDEDPPRRVVDRLSLAGEATELVGMIAYERELGPGRVSRPLRTGRSGLLWKAAKLLGAAGLVAALVPGRSRARIVAMAALTTASSIAVRFAVMEAGKESAHDPRATFEPQRASMP